MKLPIFQVDAFASKIFQGNPAAVVLLDEDVDQTLMQSIAAENNLSETSFLRPMGDGRYSLRWFTPSKEVTLCGHATLAAAHVLHTEFHRHHPVYRFQTEGGELSVRYDAPNYILSLPTMRYEKAELPPSVAKRLPFTPKAVYTGNERLMIVTEHEEDVVQFQGRFNDIEEPIHGIILTALSHHESCHFVSRYFGGPKLGVVEDPVTGSSHCLLAPYWGKKLGLEQLTGWQASWRSGIVNCQLNEDASRVEIAGQAATFLRGEITIGAVR